MAEKKESKGKEKDELAPGEVEHTVSGAPKIISDGGSAGRMELELADGGKASFSVDIQQPPKKEGIEPTGGGDPTSKAKLANQKDIAEGAAKETKNGPLPTNFPYLDKLHAADPPINTYGQLAAFADDYERIPGVGPAGKKAITEAVAE